LGGSLPSQVIASRLLPQYDEIRRERRLIIAQRLEQATHLLADLLPGWTWDNPQGGLCLWVRLPYGSGTEFAQLALRSGVSIVAGSSLSAAASLETKVRWRSGPGPGRLKKAIDRRRKHWDR